MYRRPRFLEILIAIREEMAREADFDMDLFIENLRTGHRPHRTPKHSLSVETPSNGKQDSKNIGQAKR